MSQSAVENTDALIKAVMATRRAQGFCVQCGRETPELTKEIGPFTAYFSTAGRRDRFIAKADAKGRNPQIIPNEGDVS